MSSRRGVSLLTFVCFALPTAATAQQQDSTARRPVPVLDPIVVTAERRPTAASDAVAPVLVIDRATLERRAATDVTSVLRDAPGVQLEAVVGSGTGLYLQGLGSDRVLVLLDGAPLAGRLNGQFDLSRVSPSQLQRIEVVEGPQSTLYGSTALGGVVNLITRRDVLPRAEVAATAGSFGQRDVTGRLSAPVGGFLASLEGGHRTVDRVPGAFPTTLGGAARWDWLGRLNGAVGRATLDARLTGTREDQHYAIAPISPHTTTAFIYNDNAQYDGLTALTFGPDGATEVRVHGSWYDHRYVNAPVQDRSAVPATWDRQRLADIEAIRRGTLAGATWVAGAKAEREWLLSARIARYRRAASTGAVYASAEWPLLPGLRATTGLRVTRSETWGSDLSPRLGLSAHAVNGLYAKTGVARGFRAPSFKELYTDLLQAQFGYAVRGNTALRPERSWNGTAEVGLARRSTQVYLRGFANRLRGFIETGLAGDSAGIGIYTYQNIGRARTGGVETGGSVTRGIATANASYSWLSTRDIDTDTDLLGRATRSANAGLTLARGSWSARAEGIYTGRTPVARSRAGLVSYQSPFTRVNLNAATQLSRGMRLTVGVDNLTDASPAGAALLYGRRAYVQAAMGLGW